MFQLILVSLFFRWLRVEKKFTCLSLTSAYLMKCSFVERIELNELRMKKNIRNYLPYFMENFYVPNLHPFSTLFFIKQME